MIENPLSFTLKKSAFIIFTVLACILAMAKVSSRQVFITFENQNEVISTLSNVNDVILNEAGIMHKQSDVIKRNDVGNHLTYINIYRPHRVTIRDNGESESLIVAGTVEDALNKAKVGLRENDTVNLPLSSVICEDTVLNINRSFEVSVKSDGNRIFTDVSTGTVSQLLNECDIELGEYDEVNYSLTDLVKKGMKIIVKRVRFKAISEKKSIEYKTTTEYSDEMYEDESVVIQEGSNGEKEIFYLAKYIDGKLSDKKVLARFVRKKPINKIILKGTKFRATPVSSSSSNPISELDPPFEIALDENGRPREYKKLITGSATAYYGGTTTSTGARAIPGRVAVDPREIPYGTKMYIVSTDGRFVYGYSIAADTGGFIYNSNTVVDLRFNTYSECVQFGRRNVEIYILE